jgi:hypothetical protein
MKILYVLGASRCGSTVLGNLLGEMDGFFSAGELKFLWERVLQGRVCGCHSRLEQCEVWGEILEAHRIAGGSATPSSMLADARASLRLHHMPYLLLQRPGRVSGRISLDRYLGVLERTYRTLDHVSAARVVVDTSKHPSNGMATWLMPGIETYFLHLVRDPRAVAYSESQWKANPDGTPTGMMPKLPVWEASLHWTSRNIASEAIRVRVGSARFARMRYEDFIARPRQAVESITRLLGERFDPRPFIDEHAVELAMNHTVSGNADRFVTGKVQLRLDDRWTRHMARRDRRIVAGLTAPLMYRYGYNPVHPSMTRRNAEVGGE